MTVDGDVNVEGSRAGIVPNAPYTIDQLFYAMFLPSGNDAATALARATGSVKSTVALMNTEAALSARARHDGRQPDRARRRRAVHLGVRPRPHRPSRPRPAGLPALHGSAPLSAAGQDAEDRPQAIDVPDQHRGQAARAGLSRADRRQDRVDHTGGADVHGRGGAQRARPHRDADGDQAADGGRGSKPAQLGLPQRVQGQARRSPGGTRCRCRCSDVAVDLAQRQHQRRPSGSPSTAAAAEAAPPSPARAT